MDGSNNHIVARKSLPQDLGKGCLQKKKNSKIWDIGPKGGRGSGFNPNFFDILIGTNTLGGRGSEGLCHKKNAINFCSPCSSFMYFRVI